MVTGMNPGYFMNGWTLFVSCANVQLTCLSFIHMNLALPGLTGFDSGIFSSCFRILLMFTQIVRYLSRSTPLLSGRSGVRITSRTLIEAEMY